MKGLFTGDKDIVSFEEFMAYALHDAQAGYYARRISTVGRGGDFTTTAEIAPALARAIAGWLRRQLCETKCVDVIELGPGSGALAASVIGCLPWYLRWRTRWHLVETSSTLREVQQARKELRRAQWHNSVEAAINACDGAACVYSNEFFDAFSVRVFQRVAQEWQELCVTRELAECWRTPEAFPESSVFRREWSDGQRVEVHASVRSWLQAMAKLWKRGAKLTIDYGARVEKMYHRQPQGSLRAYLLQQRLTGAALYQNVGRQDLTADVNFTDLMAWSEPFARTQSLQSQAQFLKPFVVASQPGDVYSIDPMGAGEAFQVWECKVQTR
jgi:SAM-dependent MidA family methyltransferase